MQVSQPGDRFHSEEQGQICDVAAARRDPQVRVWKSTRRRWPGEPSTRLLTRLIEAGASVVERDDHSLCAEHERAVAALTGLAGFYPDGYLDEVREGWQA